MISVLPSLWFHDQARQAVDWYVSLFAEAKILGKNECPGNEDQGIVEFQLENLRFFARNGAPNESFNPGISLLVSCQTREEVERLLEQISREGQVLLPLDEYPWSPWFAWVEDKYGLSWQLMYAPDFRGKNKIVPTLMFGGDFCGKAEPAISFYASVFGDQAHVGQMNYYTPEETLDPRAYVKYSEMTLSGMPLAAIDNGRGGVFSFNQTFSFQVLCETQEEIDYFWEALSSDPRVEAEGWLQDPFGVSWQILPVFLLTLAKVASPDLLHQANYGLHTMKKIDMQRLLNIIDLRY